MTREDAIKKVRWGLLGLIIDKDVWDAFETLIPELAESEDERIRKGLIEALKTSKTVGELKFILPEPTREECIAYLEKQKENPKSADSIPSDCVSNAKCEDRSPKHSDSDGTDIRDTPAYWKGWDDAMKQKEQKHPNGCFTCDEYKKGYEEGRRNGFTAGYNKAMKEVEQKEQKPWKVGANAYFTPEQKPAEWSEEDEKMRNLIVAIFEVNHPDGFFKANELGTTDMRGVHTEEIISWLKSLRPVSKESLQSHWKPSKEQLLQLRRAISGCSYDIESLVSLEEQLKQL